MKKCSKCGKQKRSSAFGWSNESKGYRRGECRKCNRIYTSNHWKRRSPEWRAEHSKQSIRNQTIKAERNSKWAAEYWRSHPCVKCGESRILTLEFHHRNPQEKKYAVSQLISTGKSLELIKKEVEKCDVLCANCHRIETAYQLNFRILKFL